MEDLVLGNVSVPLLNEKIKKLKRRPTQKSKQQGQGKGLKNPAFIYPCNQCDFKTKHKRYLKQHKEAHHEGVCYSCGQCDYKASLKCYLIDQN